MEQQNIPPHLIPIETMKQVCSYAYHILKTYTVDINHQPMNDQMQVEVLLEQPIKKVSKAQVYLLPSKVTGKVELTSNKRKNETVDQQSSLAQQYKKHPYIQQILIAYVFQMLLAICSKIDLNNPRKETIQYLTPFIDYIIYHLKNESNQQIVTMCLQLLRKLIRLGSLAVKGAEDENEHENEHEKDENEKENEESHNNSNNKKEEGLTTTTYDVNDLVPFFFNLLQKKQSESNAYQTLATLIRYTNINFNVNQIKILLHFIQESLLDNDTTLGFELLLAIVHKGIFSPILLKIMKSIQILLIRSYNEKIQQSASKILFLFLLDYPLNNKQIEIFMKIFITNISYSEKSGRIQTLKSLKHLFKRFPTSFISQKKEYFFIPLVLQLANEQVIEVKNLIIETLTSLIANLDIEDVSQLIELCYKWISSNKIILLRTSWLVLAEISMILGLKFQKFEHKTIKLLYKQIEHLKNVNEYEWIDLYILLTIFEKFSLAGFQDQIKVIFEQNFIFLKIIQHYIIICGYVLYLIV